MDQECQLPNHPQDNKAEELTGKLLLNVFQLVKLIQLRLNKEQNCGEDSIIMETDIAHLPSARKDFVMSSRMINF